MLHSNDLETYIHHASESGFDFQYQQFICHEDLGWYVPRLYWPDMYYSNLSCMGCTVKNVVNAVTQDEQLHYSPGMHEIIYRQKEGKYKIRCKDMMTFASPYAESK